MKHLANSQSERRLLDFFLDLLDCFFELHRVAWHVSRWSSDVTGRPLRHRLPAWTKLGLLAVTVDVSIAGSWAGSNQLPRQITS